MNKRGFDSGKYLKAQTKAILDRVKKFEKRLYLEFGGKLCLDLHAARVLPGYDPDTKISLLKSVINTRPLLSPIFLKEPFSLI